MNKFWTLGLALLLTVGLTAQSQTEPTPFSFLYPNSLQQDVALSSVPAIDLAAVALEDEQRANDGDLELFSRLVESDLGLENSGSWDVLPNGDRVWRLTVQSNGALAVNAIYDEFFIPEGAVLYVYNDTKEQVVGPFTHEDNKNSGYFATGNIIGDEMTLEYYETAAVQGLGSIHISQVGYAYRNVHPEALAPEAPGGSQSCEVDVNCSPEGDDWEDERQGVVRIAVVSPQGQGWCSGSMINSATLDCTPYVLTAFHCGDTSTPANFDSYIFYFNFQRSGCANGFANGNQIVTGCESIANSNDGGGNSGSDFLLLELSSTPPEAYNVYYNGWNANTAASTGGVSIHHPAGDRKKISTYTGTLISTTWGGANGSHWRVTWVGTENGHGVTEGGSSGSPIFNNSGQIVGQLTGGGSFCNDVQPGGQNQPDRYGKMSYNWTSNGSQSFERLKNFLDPENTGVLELDGVYAPCLIVQLGCTDNTAINFDPEANTDDGSCFYPCDNIQVNFDLTLDCFGEEIGWLLALEGGETVDSAPAGSYGALSDFPGTEYFCLEPGCYTFTVTDEGGDGLAGSELNGCDDDGTFTCTDQFGTVLFAMGMPNFGASQTFDFCVEFNPDLDSDGDGFTINQGDCDESNATIYPDAPELCDGIDNNCNDQTDEGITIPTWYEDLDEDGFGNFAVNVTQCEAPEGYVDNGNDCDDTRDTVYLGAPEICDDLDNDCNNIVDDLAVFPIWYFDGDNDGYGTDDNTLSQCFQPEGYVAEGGDCDDTSSDFSPGVSEICDGIDQDCDDQIDEQLQNLLYFPDVDGDGFGDNDATGSLECAQPDGFVNNSQDCDDSNVNINPDATEIANDGIDQDCNGEDLIVSIEELLAQQLKIYPNPTQGQLTVVLPDLIKSARFTVYDLAGKEVMVEQLTNKLALLSLDHVSAGVYTYSLDSSIAKLRGKLIVE